MKSIFLKGTFFLAISTVLFVVSGYAINIFLGRWLGPKEYGIYGVVIAIWTSVNLILTTGLPQAVSQNIAANKSHSESILKSALLLQTISVIFVSGVFFLLSSWISFLLKDASLTPFIQLTALIIPFNSIYSLFLGYFNGLHNFKRQSLIDSSYAVAKFVAIITLVYYFHIYGAILGFVVAAFIASIVGFHFPKASEENFAYKKLITFSIPLIGFTVFSTMHQSMDLLLVKAMLHKENLPGYYTASQSIAKIPFFILGALSGAIFPTISQSVSLGLEAHTKELIQNAMKLVLLIIAPAVAIISATSPKLLVLLYSSKYLPSASSLSILALGMGFFTIFMLLSNIINGAGKPNISLVFSVIAFITTVASCLIFIPLFGLLGAAIGTTTGSFVGVLFSSVYILKKFHTLISIKSIGSIFISAFLIYLLATNFSVRPLLLPFEYVILFFFYIIALIILKEISKKDVILLRPILPQWIVQKLQL